MVDNAFKYCILPAGNVGEFPSLQQEMEKRDCRVEVALFGSDSFLFRIAETELHKLPSEENRPYFGDDASGYGLYFLPQVVLDGHKIKESSWVPFAEGITIPLRTEGETMPKYTKIIAVVQGSRSFPIDMLRYDNCRPATEADSRKIMNSIQFPHDIREEPVEVSVIGNGTMALTRARWESFGWRVVLEEKR